MTSILLIYPYFKPRRDRSVFRFPPLGVAYIAASLKQAGYDVKLIDCTFMERSQALEIAVGAKADVVGIYSMVTMLDDSLRLARELRSHCRLLVAGGPLPTCDPELFLHDFDVVVRGEGEQTMVELVRAFESGFPLISVDGLVLPSRNVPGLPGSEGVMSTPDRPFVKELDTIPFPLRKLLPNREYIQFGRKKYGYSITTVMSTRGCPFRCEFCSNVVYGGSYRERSAANVVDEVEMALGLGYDRISFGDDVFTLKRQRVLGVCREIQRRGLSFQWECLGRVDNLDYATAVEMKKAGCARIYFGIESGDDRILTLMNKKITTQQARRAVDAAHRAGIQVGAFFILFYPGDTDDTVIRTIQFATSLPLDYLGLTMPYPLPGTDLFTRVQDRIDREWRPDESIFGSHVLIFRADHSELKMWFGIFKGRIQFLINRRLGFLAPFVRWIFEKPSDLLLRALK